MAGILPEDIESSDDQKQDLRETPSIEPEPLHDRDLPMHKAAYKGDHAEVPSLIMSGVNINARSIFECTPLRLAIRGDHAETVRILLSAGADVALLDEIEPCIMAPFDAINGAAWLGAHHALGALIDFTSECWPALSVGLLHSIAWIVCARFWKSGTKQLFRRTETRGLEYCVESSGAVLAR
jgi:hypothetical protein